MTNETRHCHRDLLAGCAIGCALQAGQILHAETGQRELVWEPAWQWQRLYLSSLAPG
jgi:hypothetical protein